MHSQRVESLSQAQRERLAYIDFRLYYMGEVGRPALTSRFGLAPAAATRDLAVYREIAPQNIEFDGSYKQPGQDDMVSDDELAALGDEDADLAEEDADGDE